MKIAIVGCGFVADYYVKTLTYHPELELVGVMDRDLQRAEKFSKHHSTPYYRSLEELLDDNSVEIVLNLTNPSSHYAVSKACLEAGRHVYSEKPFSTELAEAQELVELAARNNLYITSAPCNLLGETAQTIWKALQEDVAGTVRIVYAEMDDGMVHQMAYKKWLSESGTPWPYKDEFEVGCTLEHAGYYVTWLAAYFGPATTVTTFADCTIPDKQTDVPLEVSAPDFTVACIKFASGVVARLTCSIVAPHDHTLRIVGDNGILTTKDCWYYDSPVYFKPRLTIRRKTFISPFGKKYPLVGQRSRKFGYKGSQQMDFSRGVAELARAIAEGRPCQLPADYCLHVNEIVLAIQNANVSGGGVHKIASTFAPLQPSPWS